MGDSSKDDQVSQNAIWTEHCVREARCLRMNLQFGGLRSPSKIGVLTEKPTQVQPCLRAPSEDSIEKAKQTLSNLCIVQDEASTPEQRFVLPVTATQEYGFFSKPLIDKSPLFHHARNSCEVTSYADRYYSMSGRSPYAKKPDS